MAKYSLERLVEGRGGGMISSHGVGKLEFGSGIWHQVHALSSKAKDAASSDGENIVVVALSTEE